MSHALLCALDELESVRNLSIMCFTSSSVKLEVETSSSLVSTTHYNPSLTFIEIAIQIHTCSLANQSYTSTGSLSSAVVVSGLEKEMT